jgi:hypothetical protein
MRAAQHLRGLFPAIVEPVARDSLPPSAIDRRMTTATLLSSVLALAPPNQTSPADRVETTYYEHAAEVALYDDKGELEAVLVLHAEPGGPVRLDVDFTDGLYLSAVTNGEDATVDTNDGAEVAERLMRLDAALHENAALPEWLRCGGPAAFAVCECVEYHHGW